MVFPHLETKRLLLRPLRPGDEEGLLHYRSIPEVCRYVPFEPMDRAEIDRRMGGQWAAHDLSEAGSAVTLGVVLRGTDRLIGDVLLRRDAGDARLGEIGYIFTPEVAGHGYATEASHALLDHAFGELGLHRVMARIDARNSASARVLDRIGMRLEARFVENEWFKGEWSSTWIYAMLHREWRGGIAPDQ